MANMRHRAKCCAIWSNHCRDIVFFSNFTMLAAAILDILKFQICNDFFDISRWRIQATFSHNRSNCFRNITFFDFFQDGGYPPSWICNVCVGTTHEGHLVVFITVQNLVGIDAAVLVMCAFFDFASSTWKRLFAPKNCFWGFLTPWMRKKCEQKLSKRHILTRVRVVWAMMR